METFPLLVGACCSAINFSPFLRPFDLSTHDCARESFGGTGATQEPPLKKKIDRCRGLRKWQNRVATKSSSTWQLRSSLLSQTSRNRRRYLPNMAAGVGNKYGHAYVAADRIPRPLLSTNGQLHCELVVRGVVGPQHLPYTRVSSQDTGHQSSRLPSRTLIRNHVSHYLTTRELLQGILY